MRITPSLFRAMVASMAFFGGIHVGVPEAASEAGQGRSTNRPPGDDAQREIVATPCSGEDAGRPIAEAPCAKDESGTRERGVPSVRGGRGAVETLGNAIAAACAETCNRKASDCLESCEERFRTDDKGRVTCKFECASQRQQCEKDCS